MVFDKKLWVLGGYNGHPYLYPEELADTPLPVVGSEGNRNDVCEYIICVTDLAFHTRLATTHVKLVGT